MKEASVFVFFFFFFDERGQVVPYLRSQDNEGESVCVCVSGKYVAILLVSYCAGVTWTFTNCREIHLPFRKQFVFHFEYLDNNIKSNFFYLFRAAQVLLWMEWCGLTSLRQHRSSQRYWVVAALGVAACCWPCHNYIARQ